MTDSKIARLPSWLLSCLQPLNTDFEKRVVCTAQSALWCNTSLKGIQLRVMEYVPGTKTRLVAQLRFAHAHVPAQLSEHRDIEILMQQGHLVSELGDYRAHWYFRIPGTQANKSMNLNFQRAPSMNAQEDALLYLAAGQMQQSDLESRRINTREKQNWFPGPVEGTDVLPLHGHGSGNVMLVRWNKAAAFKTRIDPLGEELLVLSGSVHDSHGSYTQNTWIRNPVAAWQPWGAKAGTVIYYKNGHFAQADTARPDIKT